MSLSNQATFRAEVGDRTGALAAADEAVTLYRRLFETNPAVFTPNLAMALSTQAISRSEVGDRTGALSAIDEAVTPLPHLRRGQPGRLHPQSDHFVE